MKNLIFRNTGIQPIIKWVGGKRQLLNELWSSLPFNSEHSKYDFTSWCEPFVGGGAFWLSMKPQTAFINDANPELINLYGVVRDSVDSLIHELKQYKNDIDFFNQIRAIDKTISWKEDIGKIKRAARFIYLNKTCFNGLWRVNSKGCFNVPFGKYKNPNIVNEEALLSMNKYLKTSDVHFSCGDYKEALKNINKDTFIYFDPPYDPVSKSSNFTSYTQTGFNKENQIELRDICDYLSNQGYKWMLSNSDTEFIRELYSKYKIKTIQARRCINVDSNKRGNVNEVLIVNF